MESAKFTLNELLVELFNHILILEEKNLRERGVHLTMSEVHTLENIRKSKSKTMSDVAKKLLVTQGTLTVAINRLVKKGYVTRTKDEHDKRIVRLGLTEKADSVMVVHDAFHEEMIDSMITDMNIDEDKNLLNSLRRVMDYFKQNYEDQ